MQKTFLTSLGAIALLGTASVIPASAQVARFDPGLTTGTSTALTNVQFRRGFRGHYGYGRYGFNRGYRGFGRYGYRGYGRYGYGGYNGAGLAAGAAGLAAGALIGGAIASQAAPVYSGRSVATGDAVAYCSQRFKSYDPSRGTYLGYDGDRHACP